MANIALAGPSIVTFTPADGATVTTSAPVFTVTMSGTDPTKSSDNPFIAISTSFQTDGFGEVGSMDGLPCLMAATPLGPTSSTYTAQASPTSFCQLRSGATYYWQIQFASADPPTAGITCDGVRCHTAVMKLTYAPTSTTSPGATMDTTAPTAKAVAQTLHPGVIGELYFRASDDSGRAFIALALSNGVGVVWRKTFPAAIVKTGVTYQAAWTPRKRGLYVLCVQAVDASSNTSKASCARITVK